jgi:hypothetical protein
MGEVRSQNLVLFIRGKTMSGDPNISGTSQFPKPPIIIGIIIKKIIRKAWAVTMTYVWSSPIGDPGCHISVRISILKDVQTIPDQAPNTKYSVAKFLRLVAKNHPVKMIVVAEINK